MVTFLLSLLAIGGITIMLYSAVALVQNKRFFGSAPKDIQKLIQPKTERFKGQHFLGLVFLILSMVMVIATAVLAVWNGVRNHFGFWQFFVRFLTILYAYKAYDMICFDFLLLTRSHFFQKYYHDCRSKYRVTGMWRSYQDAYSDKMKESEADIHIEKLNARILLIAGTGDEMWPSDYSVRYLEKSLRENHYKREYKAIFYKGAGHLLGIMPSHKREAMLYKMIPIIGIFYQRFRDSRSICMDALEKSEREIVEWLVNSGKLERDKQNLL